MVTELYLGDAVYAEFNGAGIVLTTRGGSEYDIPTNTIILDANVLECFDLFRKQLQMPEPGE